MSDRASITVDLRKIEENARRVVRALPGVSIVGVTKVACGAPEVARAMLAGGVAMLGESRLENAARLREAGVTAPIWLIRAPSPGVAADAVRLVDVSLVSDVAIAEGLDAAAGAAGLRHLIVAMVDTGDLREGMWPDALPAFLEAVSTLRNIDVTGIGTNLTCFGAIVPDANNLGLLGEVARDAERRLGRALTVSVGGSASIVPIMAELGHDSIDNLRVGEAIVLGVDPSTQSPIPGLELHMDAVTLTAPVIECFVKPSKPIGTSTLDAFGNVPDFQDIGLRRRGICAVGRQDVPPQGLTPVDPRVKVLGASSDHLVLDVDALPVPPRVGESLSFTPSYAAMLALFTSPYITKVFV
jgi:predicted amino acid racemase